VIVKVGSFPMNTEYGVYVCAKERLEAMSTTSRVEDMGYCRSQVEIHEEILRD